MAVRCKDQHLLVGTNAEGNASTYSTITVKIQRAMDEARYGLDIQLCWITLVDLRTGSIYSGSLEISTSYGYEPFADN